MFGKIISPIIGASGKIISEKKKKGASGINIKPGNEGKFTAWAKRQGFSCDNGVPQAAIKKGLNSNNPKVVKMANFARNAKKWNKK